jgi:hypothetical protein
MGVHDVESHNELISDIGDEHLRFIGHLPEVSFMKASFKMEGVSPGAVYRAHHVGGSLSGSPAVMSSLAMVMDTLVSIVMNHSLSPIQPWAIRPLLALLVIILGLGWKDGNGDTGILPFPPAPTRFLMVGHLATAPTHFSSFVYSHCLTVAS